MHLTRAFGKTISRLLIGALLFAQFAVASHACPILQAAGSTAGPMAGVMHAHEMATAASMPPGCEAMDADSANVCAEHCRQGQQGVDTTPAPLVTPGLPTLLYSIPLEPRHAPGSLGAGGAFPAAEAGLAAAPEPPHAILHCVFRI